MDGQWHGQDFQLAIVRESRYRKQMWMNSRDSWHLLPFHFVDKDNSQGHMVASFQVLPFLRGRATDGWHGVGRQAPIHRLEN